MKTHLYKIFALCMLIFLGWSCTDEPIANESAIPSAGADKVNVELYTNADDFKAPTRTGSADESGLGDTPWVIVFRGNDNNAAFFEVVQAVVVGTKSYAQLTKTTQPSRMLMIANPPTTFFNGSSEVAFNAANLAAYFSVNPAFGSAVDGLCTSKLTQPNQTTVPYASTTAPRPMLPMTGLYDVSSINTNTAIGTSSNKFLLTRAVAKVTVTSTAANFQLLSATVVNAPVNGRLYQNGAPLKNNTGNLTDYLTTTSGDGVSGIAVASANSTVANPIYFYESRKEENTSVIIKTTYNSTPYYYRLAFTDNNTSVMDALRNKYYSFTITAVYGPGWPTVAEAKANIPSNIKYAITVTDQVSYDMTDNGQYYVGVSNSEYYLYSTAAITTIAFSISTNATAAMLAGSTNSITYTNTAGIPFVLGTSSVALAPTAGSSATTDVMITLPEYIVSGSSGTVTIRLGNITKTVKLSRDNNINSVMSSLFFSYGTNNTSATIISQGAAAQGTWLSLSNDRDMNTGAQNLVLPSAGTIYVMATDNLSISGAPVRTGGEVYITRSDLQGRIKLSISQNGGFTQN